MRLPLATLVCALLLAAGASAAATSGSPAPGVHIDPGSPVAKEYAIPLAQARAGSGSSGGQLFGQGIVPARSASSAPATTPAAAGPPAPAPQPATATAAGSHAAQHAHRSGARQRTRSAHRATQAAAPAAVAASGELAASSHPAGGGGAGIEWMVGVAALVLALGGLGGAVLARHSRSASTRTS